MVPKPVACGRLEHCLLDSRGYKSPRREVCRPYVVSFSVFRDYGVEQVRCDLGSIWQ
jgi:hypothetical protein